MPENRTMYAVADGPFRDIFDTAERIQRIGKLPFNGPTTETLIREMVAMSTAISAAATLADRVHRNGGAE